MLNDGDLHYFDITAFVSTYVNEVVSHEKMAHLLFLADRLLMIEFGCRLTYSDIIATPFGISTAQAESFGINLHPPTPSLKPLIRDGINALSRTERYALSEIVERYGRYSGSQLASILIKEHPEWIQSPNHLIYPITDLFDAMGIPSDHARIQIEKILTAKSICLRNNLVE